jgi:hypothetical protein
VQTPTAFEPYLMTAQTQAVVKVSTLNATNVIWVYAVDQVGNSSAMVGDPVLVLASGGDWDGDGYTNADEEWVGTDAADGRAVLRLQLMPLGAPAGAVAICWMTLEGRLYTLQRTATLVPAPEWRPVPGLTAVPGTNAMMLHVPDAGANKGFYRLIVQ